MNEGRNAFKILTDEPTGKGRLGKPRRRLGDNDRMGFKEICVTARKWVDSAKDGS